MKVLFATYPMAFHTPGGGEMQLRAYARHLPALDVKVALFDPWKPQFGASDLVHFFSVVGGSTHFCAFVKRLGLPLVVSSSLWITGKTKSRYPVGEIRDQLRLADRVIVNSDIEGDTLARVLDLPRDRFATIRNGIEARFLRPADPQPFRDAFRLRGPFILNVANIEPRKNQLNLARAAAAAGRRLVLVGHVRDPAYLAAVNEAGGRFVRHLGPLDHDSPLLPSAYAACALFALPSTLETPGLAALEAAAQGARILVTAEGAAPEYFGALATYVRGTSARVVGAAVERALAAPHGGAALTRLAAAHTWKKVLAPLPAIYRSIIEA